MYQILSSHIFTYVMYLRYLLSCMYIHLHTDVYATSGQNIRFMWFVIPRVFTQPCWFNPQSDQTQTCVIFVFFFLFSTLHKLQHSTQHTPNVGEHVFIAQPNAINVD